MHSMPLLLSHVEIEALSMLLLSYMTDTILFSFLVFHAEESCIKPSIA